MLLEMIEIISTNNHLGQHEYKISYDGDRSAITEQLLSVCWTRPVKIEYQDDAVYIHCFNNYDKARIERLFLND